MGFRMGRSGVPQPVRTVVSAIFADRDTLSVALDRIAAELGPLRELGEEMSFDFTTYYDKEMGAGLRRRLLVVDGLSPPDGLPALKRMTNELEQQTAVDGRRRVNLDPGALSSGRFALASTKDAPHRIYLGEGIFAELTLVYQSGGFQALPWTYPDYAASGVRALLEDERRTYLSELKEAS